MYRVRLHFTKLTDKDGQSATCVYVQESPMPIITCSIEEIVIPFGRSPAITVNTRFCLNVGEHKLSISADVFAEGETFIDTDLDTFQVAMAGTGWALE